jgi:hypothetical protein
VGSEKECVGAEPVGFTLLVPVGFPLPDGLTFPAGFGRVVKEPVNEGLPVGLLWEDTARLLLVTEECGGGEADPVGLERVPVKLEWGGGE